MKNTATPIKMTLAIPADVAQAMEQERARMAADLRTRLSFNQVATRLLALGLDASRAA